LKRIFSSTFLSGEVANKFYNDMETPVQIILGPIGSGKTFALQMKIIKLACEQIPVYCIVK
jgi:Ni2+-binding GTPase involved in maturation of urease and hydrogenase